MYYNYSFVDVYICLILQFMVILIPYILIDQQ